MHPLNWQSITILFSWDIRYSCLKRHQGIAMDLLWVSLLCSHVFSIISLDLQQKKSKVKLLRIPIRWQQIIKTQVLPFRTGNPVQLHRSHAHEASLQVVQSKLRYIWIYTLLAFHDSKLLRKIFIPVKYYFWIIFFIM